MNKTDVVKIIDENRKEAHDLLWKNGKVDEEFVLPSKVFVICGLSEGYITKVKMETPIWENSNPKGSGVCDKFMDACMEMYFEDNAELDSGWTDYSDISYGYENDVYLAIEKALASKR